MSCWDVAWVNDLTPEQFVLWNPSLDQNSDNATSRTYDYDCTVTPSMSYCYNLASPTATPAPAAVPPSPRGAGEISGCTRWLKASSDCSAILNGLRMTVGVFYQMNPSVGAGCTGLNPGTYYCYSTNEDGLSGIGTTEDSGATTTLSSTASSTSSTGVVTPTPIQDGMTSDCNKFHFVVSGDGCYAIASNAGINLADFYKWHPAVQTDCSRLFLDTYVCIGVSSSASASATPTPTSATATPTGNKISTDGTCGGTAGMTCAGSQFGTCCSSSGYCGSTSAYCGGGCQSPFGSCETSGGVNVSPDGTCGGTTSGYTCAGSSFGTCCSSSG
jgi:hypothetical protein